MSDLLTSLNDRQLDAVTAPEKSVLVLAGAGSGKTRVLTTRIAWLLSQCNVYPRQIMAVTFTTKAAKEMVTRLESMINLNMKNMMVGTFHGICNRILRAHAAEAGLSSTFMIMDNSDQLAAVKRVLKSLNIPDDKVDARAIQHYINWNKENAIRPSYAQDDIGGQGVAIYRAYEAQCQKEGTIDFAELLLRCYELLERNELLRNHYQERFRHILVDEFQDTNVLQYRWIQLLAGLNNPNRPPNCVFAVGDDDQSIYAFRGACVGNMSQFLKDFGVENPIRLEENYRSTSVILNAANALISQNAGRLGKNLWTSGSKGDPISLVYHDDDRAEASWVADQIVKSSSSYRDNAILYRTNSQSRALEHALQSKGIPYRIYGGLRFFERQEVKDVMAYLRLIANPHDDTSFIRVVNKPSRLIGAKSIDTLRALATQVNMSLWSAASHPQLDAPARIKAFVDLMNKMVEQSKGMDLCDLIKFVMSKSGLYEMYAKEKDGEDRCRNMSEIVSAAQGFLLNSGFPVNQPALQPFDDSSISPLVGFLTATALDAGEKGEGDDLNAVQLMTVHASKGLEFPNVYIVGVEQGIFPHYSALNDPRSGEDEERRLMYVAITRAKRRLAMSHCKQRMQFGKINSATPSKFIEEIPMNLLKEQDLTSSTSFNFKMDPSAFKSRDRFGFDKKDDDGYDRERGYTREQSWKDEQHRRAFASKDKHFAQTLSSKKAMNTFGFGVGDLVEHPKYGQGKVQKVYGTGDDTRAVIEFKQFGVRELLLSIASKKLTKLS